MKPQTTKKLFAFIITILFTISFLQAQYCSGKKVGMCKTTGLPECRCVNQGQVQKYLAGKLQLEADVPAALHKLVTNYSKEEFK